MVENLIPTSIYSHTNFKTVLSPKDLRRSYLAIVLYCETTPLLASGYCVKIAYLLQKMRNSTYSSVFWPPETKMCRKREYKSQQSQRTGDILRFFTFGVIKLVEWLRSGTSYSCVPYRFN